MGVSSPKQAEITALQTKIQATDRQKALTDIRTKTQTLNRLENVAKSVLKSEKQVSNSAENKTQIYIDAVEPEQEQDVEMEQKRVQTSEKDEEISVISSDVSPHDSDFDFLQINPDSGFSLLTPSPHCRGFPGSIDTEMVAGPLASPCLSSHGSSAACSPSQFFKSPLGTSDTPQRQNIVPIRLATPKRMLKDIDSLCQQKELNVDGALAANVGDIEVKQGIWRENVVSTSARLRKASTLATPPRTPSPSARQQLLSRYLKDVFNRTDDEKEQEIARKVMISPAETGSEAYQVDTSASMLDADDIHCVPSGLLTSLNEHDSFFSFANSLSPLMSAEVFEDSFMPVKLSPLVSLSYELPRLLPPFPEQEPNGDRGTASILKTPQNKSNRKRGILSAESLAGSGISTGSASELDSLRIFAESFPNIQASTSATPGKVERLKLGGHSIMKMKLHTSFGASPSLLDSHSTREIQAINNSLKRKKYIRRRKAEEKRQQTSFSNVQRKLLQTPAKSSASPRTITRSPLRPWNGQTSQTGILETPTPRKLDPSQQTTKVAPDEALLSSSVAHRLISATDPVPAPATPVGNNKKRKASQCVSMPTSISDMIGLKMRKSPLGLHQAVALAITPAKQIKREVTTTPGKYNMLTPQMMVTCGASGMDSFNDTMLKTLTPVGSSTSLTPVGSSTSLTTSLQSTSKALLGGAVMVIPSQVPKKAPCNCKKSKCLKLYCECFRLGGYCDENCNCFDCANTTETEEVRQQAIASRLEKNPNAFKPKISATSAAAKLTPGGAHRLSIGASGGSGSLLSPPGQMSFQQQQQILSAGLATTKMHKHGCHCKKSACQKKYCECFQAGVPCGENCRCIDCKNQTPSVAHGNGIATATSTLSDTPSRIANELDETFLSPILQNVRQRMRIDRETWKKDFSSPFEASPGRERDRTERLQSRLLASRSASAAGIRVRAVSFTSPSTPQVKSQSGAKRSRGMSPVRGQDDEQRIGSTEAANTLMYPKKRGLQQYSFTDRIDNTVGVAALSAVVRSSAGTERVFVLPLFGARLPPLENGVSAKVFCFLTNADLHNASLVSHLWNQVALGDTVWDHANFIPTVKNAASGRRSHKKKKLETRMKLKPSVVTSSTRSPMVAIKHEHSFAMLSTLSAAEKSRSASSELNERVEYKCDTCIGLRVPTENAGSAKLANKSMLLPFDKPCRDRARPPQA